MSNSEEYIVLHKDNHEYVRVTHNTTVCGISVESYLMGYDDAVIHRDRLLVEFPHEKYLIASIDISNGEWTNE